MLKDISKKAERICFCYCGKAEQRQTESHSTLSLPHRKSQLRIRTKPIATDTHSDASQLESKDIGVISYDVDLVPKHIHLLNADSL
jgi:hypothetical protein